jgi:uncharacterized phage protein (TIGR02218 family)
MADARVTQGPVLGVIRLDVDAKVTQAPVIAVYKVGAPSRVTQGAVLAVYRVIAPLQITQSPVLIVYRGGGCGTRECQIWTIERTDGEIFRFTSLDKEFEFGGHTYQACDSLNPSASESVSEVDAAGSMDLSGALGTITEHELFAGLFDGAHVEAWLVPWEGTSTPKPLLSGTFGTVEHTNTGFKVEVIGDGAKLMQTPLVSLLQPGCRWKFGDPVTCGKDLAPLTVTGTIDSASGLREFTDAARAEAAGYFKRGRVTFTSGDNAGISAEIKEHEAGGVFTLWPRLAFSISPGDTYSMTPGCTNIKDSAGGTNGCTAWGQLVRYGGFDKVPGGDKRSAAANVR